MGAVLVQRTVNLAILSTCSPRGKALSAYRRFQRFLSGFALPALEVGRFILGRLPRPRDGFVLVMDRSVWQLGHTPINLLFVGVVLGGMGVPIAWSALPKRARTGCPGPPPRIRMMKKAMQVLDGAPVRVLLMDREFGGKQWLSWLERHDPGYVVRVKSNHWIGPHKADWLGRRGRWRRHRRERFAVCGQQVHFAAKAMTAQRTGRLLVISNRFCGQQALELYRLRWGIESFFAHLKSRGLNFEDTHLRAGPRLERLCAVLAVAFVLAYANGWRMHAQRAVPCQKNGQRAKSLFRSGLEDFIRACWRADFLSLDLIFSSLLSSWPPPPSSSFVV